jgi:hypothetical protein
MFTKNMKDWMLNYFVDQLRPHHKNVDFLFAAFNYVTPFWPHTSFLTFKNPVSYI